MLSPGGSQVEQLHVKASRRGEIELKVAAGDGQLEALVVDLDVQPPADRGVELDLGGAGGAWTHPFGHALGIQPFPVDLPRGRREGCA